MHLTNEDIEQLTQKYGERLKQAAAQLPEQAPTITDLQDWMQNNHIENPEVMELALKKIGTGTKAAGKKNMS